VYRCLPSGDTKDGESSLLRKGLELNFKFLIPLASLN
jgi:hypothetical protein